MKRLPVVIRPEVREQIRAQVREIAAYSIDYALAWEDRLTAALDLIGEIHGDAVEEDVSEALGETIHKAVFERTYLIFYRVDDTQRAIEIINFRHGYRRPWRGRS